MRSARELPSPREASPMGVGSSTRGRRSAVPSSTRPRSSPLPSGLWTPAAGLSLAELSMGGNVFSVEKAASAAAIQRRGVQFQLVTAAGRPLAGGACCCSDGRNMPWRSAGHNCLRATFRSMRIPSHDHEATLWALCRSCGLWGVPLPSPETDVSCGNCGESAVTLYTPPCCIRAAVEAAARIGAEKGAEAVLDWLREG